MSIELDELAKGLVAGVVIERVRSTTRLAIVTAALIAAAAVVAAVLLSGFLAWVFAALAVVAIVLVFFALILRLGAIAAIRHVGEPEDLSGHRGAIESAIDDADLPTGPLSATRLAWRLRRGAPEEVQRIGEIVARLRNELDA